MRLRSFVPLARGKNPADAAPIECRLALIPMG